MRQFVDDIAGLPNNNQPEPGAGTLQSDTQPFEKLVRQYQSYAYALAMKFLCNEDEASDVVQETFLRVWMNFDRYDPRRKFTTWLYRIVANLCIDRLRSLNRNRGFLSSKDQESVLANLPDERDWEKLQSHQQLAEIIALLGGGLSPRQRLVFTLRDLQDLSVAEVVEITGMSAGSVKTNLFYARKAIRDMLARRYGVIRSDV